MNMGALMFLAGKQVILPAVGEHTQEETEAGRYGYCWKCFYQIWYLPIGKVREGTEAYQDLISA